MMQSEFQGPGWRIGQWLDWTFDVAIAADAVVLAEDSLTDELLLGFWHAGRRLAVDWSTALDRLPQLTSCRQDLNQIVVELLAGELALRVGCSILAAHDRRHGQNSARPLAESVMDAVAHARHKMLGQILQRPATDELDQFRRRCERWTDMLIGPLLVRFGEAGYAHDSRRAWEFGEDHCQHESVDAAVALMKAGYRTAFRCPLTEGRFQSSGWWSWCSAMLGTFSRTTAAAQFTSWNFRLAAAETGSTNSCEHMLGEIPHIDGLDPQAVNWSPLERALHAVSRQNGAG